MFGVRGAIALLVGVTAGVVGVPIGSLAPGRACAAGQTHVAVVVDFGGVATTTATCVAAGSRDNGATLLAARASQLGTPAPRFGSSGLLCAIDGIPARGCGEAHGKKYAYWSYWHGTGGAWSYSNVGPSGWRVAETVVEGWRWQPNGGGNPTDPPPRGSARPTATCVVATGGPPRTTARPAPPPPPSRGSDPTVVPFAPPVAGRGTGTPTTAPPHHESTTTRATSELSDATAPTSLAAGALAATRNRRGSSGSSVPVGFIVGVMLIGGLALAGVLVARRRSRPAS